MKMDVCKYTDKGGRKNNEDCLQISSDENILIVADGLGGHSCGEVASSIVVDNVMKECSATREYFQDTLHEIFVKVNSIICTVKQDNTNYGNMASTVVCAVKQNNYLHYANVGDSRLYYFRKGDIIRQTRDHSLTQVAVDTGDIKPSKMRFHKDRNKLTKALGIQSNLNVKERYDPIEMMSGDSILMCTDGFWEYIDEKQMCKTLKKTDTAQEWMNTMLRVISKNIKKGNDNLTAIVAKIID